jgi:hypothetical protein
MLKRDNGLPRNNRGMFGMRGANLSGHGIRSEKSGGPYRRGLSEIFGNNEEAAQGQASSCRMTHEATETYLRRSWIPEEVGCRLHEGAHHAAVAWAKGNVFRKILTQGNCGPRKELATAGRRMTHRAKVAQFKGNIVKNNRTRDNVVQGILKGWTLGRRQ